MHAKSRSVISALASVHELVLERIFRRVEGADKRRYVAPMGRRSYALSLARVYASKITPDSLLASNHQTCNWPRPKSQCFGENFGHERLLRIPPSAIQEVDSRGIVFHPDELCSSTTQSPLTSQPGWKRTASRVLLLSVRV